MRVSPKYSYNFVKREQNCTKGRTSIRKGRSSITCIAGTLLVKGPEEKGQTKSHHRSKYRVSNKTSLGQQNQRFGKKVQRTQAPDQVVVVTITSTTL